MRKKKRSEHGWSIEEEIEDTQMGKPHVVILGAGASRAACPDGDRNGVKLPTMDDFVETLGLEPILNRHGIGYFLGDNFEVLYSKLHDDEKFKNALREIEGVIERYFSSLILPDSPTIYDFLVCSLRKKDLIATFNWDPFLFSACYRNRKTIDIPQVAYLHGNVAIGYCHNDNVIGSSRASCSHCKMPFTRIRLLYPIQKKNYAEDVFIAGQWEGLREYLKDAFMLTIFGYGAPTSDVEAIKLMSEAWGNPDKRSLEQIEIIDIKPSDELTNTWDDFIHTHHYETHKSFFDSWIFQHPRRTGEAYWARYMEAKFINKNLPPRDTDLLELQNWFSALLNAEKEQGTEDSAQDHEC